MEHSGFVQAWKAGELEVDVDRSRAIQIANSNLLPRRYQIAHIFWSWAWILSIPVSFAIMFLYKWWAGLLILMLVPPVLSRSTKKSAMQFMIDHSIEDPDFYQFAVSEGIIRIRQKL
jgi:hypothetical protein